MNNNEKVREWVLNKYKTKRIEGFNPVAITKELNIPINEVYKCCGELAQKDKILQMRYQLICGCDFKEVYDSIASIPEECDWCGKEIDKFGDTIIEFKFIR